MTPMPPWMIEQLERSRREREAEERPALHIVDDYPLAPPDRERAPRPAPREPIVIEL